MHRAPWHSRLLRLSLHALKNFTMPRCHALPLCTGGWSRSWSIHEGLDSARPAWITRYCALLQSEVSVGSPGFLEVYPLKLQPEASTRSHTYKRQECLQLWLCALLIETFISLPSMNPKRLFKLKFRGTTKQACLPQSWGRKQGWHSFFFGLLRDSVVTAYWLFWLQCGVWFVQQ